MRQRQTFHEILLLKTEIQAVCETCLSLYEKISLEHCPACYKNGARTICQDCKQWQAKGYKVKHESIYSYNSAMKDYFSKYKFQGDYCLRYVFAKDLKESLAKYKDYQLVPIPVSDERLSDRGFNQVEGLLTAANLKYMSLLEKEVTVKQSSKTRQARLSTEQVFSIKDNAVLPDKILLVDDVYTTGATLYLAYQCLYEAGVKEIRTFSLAR